MSMAATSPEPPRVTAGEFLEQIHLASPPGHLNLFSISTDGDRHVDWGDINQLRHAARQRVDTCDVWFGVAPRHTPTPGRRGGKEDCVGLGSVFVDIDIAGPGHASDRLPADETAARRLLDAMPLPPSAVVQSGGGLQGWWFLAEPLDHDQASELLDRWGATWAQLAERQNVHIDNVFNLDRIMRLPGTINRKAGLERPVRIIEWHPERRFGIDDVEQYLLEPPEPPDTRFERSEVSYIGPARPGDHFNAIVGCAEVLRRAGWALKRTDRNGDQHWVRPGKSVKEGPGATIYADDGHCTIWSDAPSIPAAVVVRRPYDAFGLHVALNHDGDFPAASRELAALGFGERIVRDDDILTWVAANTTPPAPVAPTSSGDWPEPLPVGGEEIGELPEFPDVYPTWVTDHLSSTADSMQTPADLGAMLVLATLSTICAGHIRVRIKADWVEDTNTFTCTAMPPGSGKSPVYKRTAGAVDTLDTELAAASAKTVADAEARKRIAEKRAKVAEEKAVKTGSASDTDAALAALADAADLEVPAPHRLTADDATPEALTQLLAAHQGRIAVLSTEGGIFDQMAGRYSDLPNLDVYLKGWSGDTIRVDRINRPPTVVPRALLTVGVTVQPSVLAAIADRPEMTGRGVSARFMYSMPADLVGRRDHQRMAVDPDPAIEATYTQRILELGRRLATWQHPVTLTLAPDARTRFLRWRAGHETRQGPDGDLRAINEWLTKCQATVARVAGLLHVVNGGQLAENAEIDEATMRCAIEVGDYWIAHARAVHQMWGGDEIGRHAAAILRRLDGLVDAERTVTVREIHRAMHTWFPSVSDLVSPLERLVERGWIVPLFTGAIVVGRRGQPSPRFAVHPKLSRHVA